MEKQDYYETSHKQRGEWHFAHSRKEEESLFKIQLVKEILDLDLDVLKKTYELIVKKHESLRTNFIWVNGLLMQNVSEWNAQKNFIRYSDLRGEKDDNKFYELVLKEARRMPDYEVDPLISTQVFRISENAYRIVIFVEHIIFDDISRNVFTKDFVELYGDVALDKEPSTNIPVIQLKDYIAWKNKMATRKENVDYWIAREKDDSYTLDFNKLYKWYGAAPSRVREMKGKYSFYLSERLTLNIVKTAGFYKTSVPFFLVGVLVTLLSRVFDQKKILVQMFSMGRYSEALEGLLANCTDFVFLFNEVDASKGIENVFQSIKTNFYGSLDHFYLWESNETCSFTERTPFRINYLSNESDQRIHNLRPTHESLRSPGISSSSYLQFTERENGIEVLCNYSLFHYSKEMMEVFFSSYLTLIEEINII